MADFTKTVEVIFGGRDEVTPTIRSITKELDTFSEGIGKISDPLATAADFILKVDTAIAALGVTLVGFSINEASKFQSAFSGITTLFEAAPAAVEQFSTDIRDFASNSTQSIDDINSAVKQAIGAGIDYRNSLDLIRTAEELSVTGNISLASSTKLITDSLNSYGESADKAAGFANSLFETTVLGNISMPQLADGLGNVATFAANAGVSFNELLSAIAALTANGIQATPAINGLKAVISAIIDPSTQAKDLAKELGINFNATALESVGLSGVLEQVSIATGGNVDQMTKLFGSSKSLNTALTLTGLAAKDFSNDLSVLNNNTEALTTAFKKMSGDLELVMANLVNNFKLTFIDAGLKIIDQFTADVSAASDIFKSLQFSIDSGAFDQVFATLNAFGADLEATLQNIAANLPQALASDQVQTAINNLLASLGELGTSIGNLFGGVDLNTEKGLEDAIERLINIGTTLVNITKGITDSFKPLFDALAAGAGSFGNMNDNVASTIGNLLGLSKGIEVLSPLFDTLLSSIGGVGQALQSLAALKELGFITGLADSVTLLGFALKAVPLAAIATISFELTEWADINDRLIPGVDTLGTKIFEWTHSTDEAVKSTGIFIDQFPELGRNINDYSDAARSAAEGTDTLNSAGVTLAEQMAKMGLAADGTKTTFETLKDRVEETGTTVKGVVRTFEDGVTTFSDAGTAISQTFKTTGDSAVEAAKKTDEYQLKLLELASDERIKTIEATVTLNVAQLESQTKIAQSIIDGLSTTISSSADLLSNLFGLIDENTSFHNQFLLEDAIRKEQEIREQATTKQAELIDAQVEMLKAQTDSLSRGDSLITITGDGLAPELEAFMMKVLERIQIRASQDRSLYLLGLPA